MSDIFDHEADALDRFELDEEDIFMESEMFYKPRRKTEQEMKTKAEKNHPMNKKGTQP